MRLITITFFTSIFLSWGIKGYSQSVGGFTSGGASYCAESSAGFIALSGHTGAVIRWEMSSDNGNTWLPNNNILSFQSYFALSNSTCYRVLVQNGSFPPEYSTTTCITIFNTIPPEITQNNDSLISSPAASYRWFLNGNSFPNDTNQVLLINQNGNYVVETRDTIGCYTSSNDFIVSNVSIKETKQIIKSICSPNPNNGIFNIDILLDSKLKYDLKILNILGEQVLSEKIDNASIFSKQYDLSKEPNGVYFFSIESSANSKSVYRIILNK